jgi:quinoprotein glucose dehydrogenase
MTTRTLGLTIALLAAAPRAPTADGDWPTYGRDPGGTRHAPLTQITPANVARLRVAWSYRTGDVDLSEVFKKAAFECTPIVVEGTMFLTTQVCRLIALDPETGAERWVFDPRVDPDGNYSEFTSRGVSTWVDPARKPGEPGYRRLYLGTIDARLICVDAATGKPCPDFGAGGTIDLGKGITSPGKGNYQVTSPPAILRDLVITGSSIADNRRADLEEGVVRAYDARTGDLKWSWDPIPRRDSDPYAETWQGPLARKTGAANVWSLISVDEERDLVILPTTAPSPDHYGGERKGANVYANSVVALRGSTGKVVWHFQAVHHDLWDYDLPCQPVLTAIRKDGAQVPVVIQGTKMGHVFVLHRDTGAPVFPVEERAAPRSDVPGEESSPTQPFPTVPAPLLPDLDPLAPWGPDDAARAWQAERLAALRYQGRFTPPSLQGSIQFPSTAGGVNWGGLTFDPGRGILVANINRLAHVVRLFPRAEFNRQREAGAFRGESAAQASTPYGLERSVFLSPNGLPATPPPWGLILAVELPGGAVKWQRPLGTFKPELADRNWGSPMMGGTCVTASGLIFVAATFDGHLRALSIETGEELWKDKLPVPAQSTPMTYQVREGGKQYVVTCAGGHGKLGVPLGDHVIAYALP